MKLISTPLRNSIRSDVSTLCRIITITLSEGKEPEPILDEEGEPVLDGDGEPTFTEGVPPVILRYTDLDTALTFGANLYRASGIEATAVRQSSLGGGNGGSMRLLLGNDLDVTEVMVRSGALTNARYVLEVIDYRHPEYGAMILGVGRFGAIEFTERGDCEIELLGLLSEGTAPIGEVYSQECRNLFGDENCRYPKENLRVTFIIEEVIDGQTFLSAVLGDEEDDAWVEGVVTFTDGDNVSREVEVAASFIDGTIELALPPPYEIEIGQNGYIEPGCLKTRKMCKEDYNNLLNYRGEPDAPSIDQQNMPITTQSSNAEPPANSSISFTNFKGSTSDGELIGDP